MTAASPRQPIRLRSAARVGRALLARIAGAEKGGGDVDAPLLYLHAPERRPRVNFEDQSLTYLPRAEARVRIHDMRGQTPQPTLDEEGFMLLRSPTRMTDFSSREQLDAIHAPEIEAMVKEVTGAREAFALHHVMFRSERHVPGTIWGRPDAPNHGVHSDFGTSAPATAAEELERRGIAVTPRGRLAIINVWRSLRPPPQDVSLALCDARTVSPDETVATDAIAVRGTGLRQVEYLSYTFSPRHRWCYFSAMEPDEVILFRQYDERSAQPFGCPHSAFRNPAATSAPMPRLSIEARVCAYFDDERTGA